MEQLIHAFGIDIKLIVVQIVNFGLLFGLLTYFLYKPVLKFLSEREAKIKQGIENAEEASVRLQEAESEKKEIVSEAHKEAENIAERARVHAGEKSSEIVSEAETRAASLVLDTEKRCVELKAAALKESEAEVAKLAILAAEKMLREKSSQS